MTDHCQCRDVLARLSLCAPTALTFDALHADRCRVNGRNMIRQTVHSSRLHRRNSLDARRSYQPVTPRDIIELTVSWRTALIILHSQLMACTNWHPVWAQDYCRITSPCFLAECRKRRLNQASFVVCCVVCLFELYLVCVFSCTVLFVSIS